MGKFDFAYDPVAALRNAPDLLGMELKPCRPNTLQGGYYMNGERHPYRRDKLKVFISRGRVWVAEEGFKCISLPQYLIEYGGAADFKDALKMINGQSQAIQWNRTVKERISTGKVKYVGQDVLDGAKGYALEGCSLFRWMCGMFPEDKVREVWDKYNVTTDAHGNCVYWYTDQDGHILFDKRIAYKDDGHRDKAFFPPRQYRVADGYSGRCYFGANAVDPEKRIYVVESEKAVLLVDLMYGRQCVATGGKSNLREVGDNMMLLPDYDARDDWHGKGQVWAWWEKWGIPESEIPEHADIADMISYKITGKI